MRTCLAAVLAVCVGCTGSNPTAADPPRESDPAATADARLEARDAGPSPSADASNTPDAPDAGQPPAAIVLPVRLHLMQSDTVAEIQSTMDETAAALLVGEINAIWQQAAIQLEIESVVRHRSLPALDQVYLAGLSRDREAAQRAFLCPPGDCFYDTDALLSSGDTMGFNIVFVASMGGGKGGVFNGRTGAIVFAETHGAAVLAHELGHALSVAHVDCSDPCNLMNTIRSCRSDDAVGLDACQVAAAQQQAATGAPYPGMAQAPLGCTCGASLNETTCEGGASTCAE